MAIDPQEARRQAVFAFIEKSLTQSTPPAGASSVSEAFTAALKENPSLRNEFKELCYHLEIHRRYQVEEFLESYQSAKPEKSTEMKTAEIVNNTLKPTGSSSSASPNAEELKELARLKEFEERLTLCDSFDSRSEIPSDKTVRKKWYDATLKLAECLYTGSLQTIDRCLGAVIDEGNVEVLEAFLKKPFFQIRDPSIWTSVDYHINRAKKQGLHSILKVFHEQGWRVD